MFEYQKMHIKQHRMKKATYIRKSQIQAKNIQTEMTAKC